MKLTCVDKTVCILLVSGVGSTAGPSLIWEPLTWELTAHAGGQGMIWRVPLIFFNSVRSWLRNRSSLGWATPEIFGVSANGYEQRWANIIADLRWMYSHWNWVLYRASGTVFSQCFWLSSFNEICQTPESRVVCYYPFSSGYTLHYLILYDLHRCFYNRFYVLVLDSVLFYF